MIVIFDLDGTLCDPRHRLHHITGEVKNWKRFYGECLFDEPKQDIISIARSLWKMGHQIHIWTGRSDEVKQETEAWLDKWSVPYNHLEMRVEGDHRMDHEVKLEWLSDTFPNNDYHGLLCAFEDRTSMVKMYRDEGITCLQVAPGDF